MTMTGTMKMIKFPPPPPSPEWATYIPGRYSGAFKMHKREQLAKLAISSGYYRNSWQLLHWTGTEWEVVHEGPDLRDLPWRKQ